MTDGAEPVRYYLDCTFNDISLCVLWNEWPVVERHNHGTQSNMLNPFVIEGENVMRILAGPVQVLGNQFISVRLSKFESGSEERQVLFHVDWTPRFGYAKDGWYEIARHSLYMRHAFGRWRWEDARPFRIEDEAALRVKVVALRDALLAKDMDMLMGMSRLKMAELARASGRPGPAVEGVQREMLGSMFAAGVHVFSWDPKDLMFRSGAGGRLVRVRLKDNTEPLSFMGGDNMVELPLIFSHLASGFELVR